MIDPNNLLTPEEAKEIKALHDKISKSDDNRNHKLLTINTTIFAIVVTPTTFDKTNKVLFYLYLSTFGVIFYFQFFQVIFLQMYLETYIEKLLISILGTDSECEDW